MNYRLIFEDILQEIEAIPDPGKVASYIPELSKVPPDKFGIYLHNVANECCGHGDHEERFSIQSIAKVLSLTLAFRLVEKVLWERVGVEPSGTAFNSLVQLESDKGIPRNPLINAGAIVICDVLIDHLDDPKKDLLAFVRELSGLPKLTYSEHIAESEKSVGFRNAAVTNLMKDFGNIHNEIEEVLDLYFHLCSIEMSCKELARTFLYLANKGVDPLTGKRIVSSSKSKRINAIMQLCGFYDEAGEFSFRVGLPGKSGVGGGIVAIYPGYYSIALWSPRLNKSGNSFRGMQFLELFTTKTELSIF